MHLIPSRRLLLGLVFLAITSRVTSPSTTEAAMLWYNGNYDLNDGATNQNNVPINVGGSYMLEKALVYDNFVVPVGQTWSLTNLFTNNQMAYYKLGTTAAWEIRSGMSAGSGGTLLYSGDSAATSTLLTAADGNNFIDPEYQISAAVTGITLTAGTYWMAIAPDSLGYYGDQSYIETTSGAGSIGTPGGNDGNSFISNNLTGPGKVTFAASSLDYSAGVNGTITFAATVPEPASWMMLAAGLTVAPTLLRLRSRPNSGAQSRA